MLFEKTEKPTKSLHLGIALKNANQVIGDIWVYLIENDRMASVAVRLSSKYQGKGYGTEALFAMTKFCFENTELKGFGQKWIRGILPPKRCLKSAGIPVKD